MKLSKYTLYTLFECGSYYYTDLNYLHLLNPLFERFGKPVKVKLLTMDPVTKRTVQL